MNRMTLTNSDSTLPTATIGTLLKTNSATQSKIMAITLMTTITFKVTSLRPNAIIAWWHVVVKGLTKNINVNIRM